MRGKNSKKSLAILLPIILTIICFFVAPAARADWAGELVGGVISIFISAFGIILVLVIQGLVKIISYQNFIDSQAVILGWVIVRDICNMFFVVILMIIAFGTILHLENYNYKKWLPKLILMAVLINFSKTICGLLIDVAQVVMLTFVNSFKDIGGANLTDILGISDIITVAKNNPDGGFWTIVGAYVLGLIYLIIAIVVIATMLMMLVMRLVMIWIYVVLSPVAYLLAAFPGGQKYSSQWWSEFIKNLIVGPVLAFFLWLSLASLSATSSTTGKSLADSAASTPEALIKFVIAIGMLIGGLTISQQIGGAAGGLAGKGMAALQKGKALAMAGGRKIAMGDNYLARKVAKTIGWDFRPVKIKESIKAFGETSRRKDEQEIKDKSQEHFEHGGLRSVLMGMGAGEDYFHRYIDGFMGYRGIGRAAQEIAINPAARKAYGRSIDANEKETQMLEEEKKQTLAKNQPEIDRQVQEALSKDPEYNKYKLNDTEAARLKELKNKSKLSKAEKDELEGLDGSNEKAEDREAKVKRDAVDKFMKNNQEIVDIEAKLKIKESSLRELKTDIAKVQTPVAFEGRAAYRKSVEEAKAKYKSITNSDELEKAYADAEQRGDKYDQIAIMEKLSGDANLNELLRDRGYSSNAKGLHSYTHNLENDHGEKRGLVGDFSEKERVKIENDLGESEERVGHWEMAKMCGMNSRGEMESYVKEMRNNKGEIMRYGKGHPKEGQIMYDDSSHAVAAYAEILKFDPQKVVNSMNRLAMGGENGDGQFEISNLGLMIFKYLASSGAYVKNEGRILGNTAANLISRKENVAKMRKSMADEPEKFEANINLLTKKGETRGGSNLATSQFKEIEGIIE